MNGKEVVIFFAIHASIKIKVSCIYKKSSHIIKIVFVFLKWDLSWMYMGKVQSERNYIRMLNAKIVHF